MPQGLTRGGSPLSTGPRGRSTSRGEAAGSDPAGRSGGAGGRATPLSIRAAFDASKKGKEGVALLARLEALIPSRKAFILAS